MDPIEHDNPSENGNVAPVQGSQELNAPSETETASALHTPADQNEPWETRILLGILLGPKGLRAGWSIAAFVLVYGLAAGLIGSVFLSLHLIDMKQHFTARSATFGELISFLAMTAAAVVVALLERKRGNVLIYNLGGPRRASYFLQGWVAGFVALSALVGALYWGGWLHFGPVALSGGQIFKYAAMWCVAFLLVGFVEEGMFRCFLLAELTRGVNFWWALGTNACVCGTLALTAKGSAAWGVYLIAMLGLIPCLVLQLRRAESSGFWQAAWVTSTLFGYIHTGNNGENWIGIFAAAAVGFVFVVSVRVTGSAWWAIGCHAAWDWAETYFYGAADSGNVASGHYLTTTPSGSTLWSGGTDGPEGSVLILGILVLLILALVGLYGRRKTVPAPVDSADPVAN